MRNADANLAVQDPATVQKILAQIVKNEKAYAKWLEGKERKRVCADEERQAKEFEAEEQREADDLKKEQKARREKQELKQWRMRKREQEDARQQKISMEQKIKEERLQERKAQANTRFKIWKKEHANQRIDEEDGYFKHPSDFILDQKNEKH